MKLLCISTLTIILVTSCSSKPKNSSAISESSVNTIAQDSREVEAKPTKKVSPQRSNRKGSRKNPYEK